MQSKSITTKNYKTNKQLKVKLKLISNIEKWLAKIGHALNTQQLSYYK